MYLFQEIRNRVRAMLDMFRYVSICCQTIEHIPPLQSNSIIEFGARGVILVSIIIEFRRVAFPCGVIIYFCVIFIHSFFSYSLHIINLLIRLLLIRLLL